ncbi:MAG: 60S ribosomal export protein NMD3 [Candidatus Thorarchaeota archaeon]
MTAPCYLCGEPSVLDGLCQTCYDKDHPLIEFSSPLRLEICKRCSSVKIAGDWKTIRAVSDEDAREKQVGLLLDREIKPLVKGVNLTLEEEKRLDRVLHLRIHASGRSDPILDEHHEEYPLEIRFNNSICDTCSRISGGYYEAILQIRAEDRPVTKEEEEAITNIARERTISAYGKDPHAFILDIMEDKFGFDIYFGSEQLNKRISDELEFLYLAERKDNYKLVSQERGGKGKYRTTTLLRLPRYVIGDFVEVSGNLCQVLNIGKGGLACYDLDKNQRITISKKSARWKSVKFLAKESAKKAFTVVSNVYSQPLQLMDTLSYEIQELEQNDLTTGIKSGDVLHLLNHDDKWYILPSLSSQEE